MQTSRGLVDRMVRAAKLDVRLYEEVEAARKLYRRSGFAIVDITDKPIEESADEVIALVSRRLKTQPGE